MKLWKKGPRCSVFFLQKRFCWAFPLSFRIEELVEMFVECSYWGCVFIPQPNPARRALEELDSAEAAVVEEEEDLLTEDHEQGRRLDFSRVGTGTHQDVDDEDPSDLDVSSDEDVDTPDIEVAAAKVMREEWVVSQRLSPPRIEPSTPTGVPTSSRSSSGQLTTSASSAPGKGNTTTQQQHPSAQSISTSGLDLIDTSSFFLSAVAFVSSFGLDVAILTTLLCIAETLPKVRPPRWRGCN